MNNVFLPGMDAIVAGGSMIFLMGLADDIRALPASVRFIIQILISLFVIVWGDIHITFFYHEQWADLLNIPLTVLWMVGLTNAMNFFDGVDGLAASLSVIAAFFLGIIAFKTNQPALGWFAVALVGSCLGFLPYNFTPSSFWETQGAPSSGSPWPAWPSWENGPTRAISSPSPPLFSSSASSSLI